MNDTPSPTPFPAIAANDLHQAIFESANYAIISTDPTGVIQAFNRAAERLLGYTAAEVVGKAKPELWHAPADINAEAIERGLIGQAPFNLFVDQSKNYESAEYERMCITKDGRHIPVLSSVSAIRNPAGEITGYLGIATDISARKAAEEIAKRQNAFRLAIETSAPIAIATADMAGQQTYVNPAFCQMVGWSAAELIGHALPRAYWHPDGAALVQAASQRVLKDKASPDQFELLFRHRDGHAINVYSYVSPMLNEAGVQTGWLAVYLDITDRKRAEEELHESDARFRSSFDESASGMSLVSPDGRWLMVNPAACQITGYTAQELMQTTFQAITNADDLDKDLEQAAQLLADEISSYHMEKRYIHKTGRDVWVYLTVSLVRDHQGKPLYFCSQFQDITERKRTDEQLRRAKEAAEAANQAKSAFLANISHEIRTPLNAIAGFADVLENSDLAAAERREFAQTIRRNSEHLLGVLSDILDVSKIEANKMTIELLPTPMRPFLENVYAMQHGKAEDKGLVLNCTKAQNLPPVIVTDPTRLRQILLNLVGNAIKFTERGSVTINAALEGDSLLRIDVIDTGIGITPEQQQLIFEPFTQADVSHSRRFAGVGLGLAISRRLAILLGGTLELHSEPGRGSTFTLRLMLKLPAAPETPPDAIAELPLRRARVLVVEDSQDSQRLLQFLLERLDQDVEVAGNGETALAAVADAANDGHPIELIIMDMQMPVLDGYTATPKLRERGFTGPIIALTANALPEDRDRCLSIGCDEFLSKPVQPKELRRILQKFLSPAIPESAT